MKAKHRVLAAGMAAAMTLSLAACGGSASTAEPTASSTVEAAAPEATSEAASGDATEVTWWTYFGDKNIGYLQNIIDDFNNSQNQYHVTIVYQGNQMECNAKLQSTEKENLPAMFSGAVEDVAMYANSDFCVPLQKYVDADTEGWQELDDTWDALRSAYSDGQGNLIGYPIGYSYPNIFYNADLLKKAGVDPASIQSFDDLYDASKTIVDGGFATYGIGFFANGAMFNVALGREGVQAYNNENGLNGQPVTECLYDSDTTVHDSIYNMLSIYQKMGAEKLCVPYGADYQSEIIPQMASGDCAMMMGVISMTTKVLDAAAGNFEVGVIPMPSASESGKRTGEPAAGTGTYVCDNGNEKAMQGAYEFIKFASTGEQAGYFASATGYIAPNQEAYDSAAYKTYREETFPGISVVYDSLAKSDSSATNPYVAISNEVRDANKVAMETAATDPTADINTVITTAKDSIQEALDIYNQSNS